MTLIDVADMLCSHKHCGKYVGRGYAKFRYIDGVPQPFHTACYHAGPDYDINKGVGSPFTTIHQQ